MQSYRSQSVPSSTRQIISVEVDASLLASVDQFTQNLPGDRTAQRSQAIEEALRLWTHHQAKQQAHRAMDMQRRRHDEDETGWLV